MSPLPDDPVAVRESKNGPYAQVVTTGQHIIATGLGACTTMTLRIYATRHGWPLEKSSVLVRHSKTGRQDGSPPSDTFERIIYLAGQLTDEQRARLLEVAGKCPVSQTLQRTSTVRSQLAAPASQLPSDLTHVTHS